jgi:hypothetical protein
MSGHLSTEEKALFKAEIDAIRRKDFFHRVLEANKIKSKEQGNHCARRYGGIRRSSSFFGSPKTYQYNLETLKEK